MWVAVIALGCPFKYRCRRITAFRKRSILCVHANLALQSDDNSEVCRCCAPSIEDCSTKINKIYVAWELNYAIQVLLSIPGQKMGLRSCRPLTPT